MIGKTLNNGIRPENDDALNRKIRISNLISLISVIAVGLYTSVYFYYSEYPGIISNLSFCTTALLTFLLVGKRRYHAAFILQCTAAYVYFIAGTLLYGTVSNLHFFMLIMCAVVIALFDRMSVIGLYLLFGIAAFFALVWWDGRYGPFFPLPASMKTREAVIGNVNLLLLFLIISLIILFFKKGMLASQKRITEQKTLIEEKNLSITDSIQYAKRIQSALLPAKETVEKLFPGAFLYFRPKDIVSGDFYWISENAGYRFLAVSDCTGHGVPGALMSVLGVNLLTEIVENKQVTDPAAILDELRSGIVYAFSKEGDGSKYKDGMDIALIRLDKRDRSFAYAAANNPVYHISAEGLTTLPADRQPAGYAHRMEPFTTRTGTYAEGDCIVLFTDGFADQFGGPKDKKFMYQRFKELLTESRRLPDPEAVLHTAFADWCGDREQIDDVCVAGIRL